MRYEPNINDPRVRKRIQHAYHYALAHLSCTEETPHSQEALSKRFGQAQTDLSKWLRKQLLICTDHHYSDAAGLSKKYILNEDGVAHIESILGCRSTPAKAVQTLYTEEFKDELATGSFTYKEAANRRWHPIQSLKKTHKHALFYANGYNHEYDIQACAPTLLYQEALKHGLEPQPLIESYLRDRATVRARLANELQTSPEKVKKIINALFGGARVGCGDYFQLFKDLDGDSALIYAIKSNDYLNLLRESIREMWAALPVEDRRKSKLKMALYFELEARVLKAVVQFLRRTKNKHFTEHDGWVCEFMLDEHMLKRHVKETTGFDISVSHVCLRDLCENESDRDGRKVLSGASAWEKYNIY